MKQGQRGVHLLDLVEGFIKKIRVRGGDNMDEIQQQRWNDCGTLVRLLASNGFDANDRHNHPPFVNFTSEIGSPTSTTRICTISSSGRNNRGAMAVESN
jgi:hypothetical protein